MRHRKGLRRLGRTTSHRKAMFRNMVTSLLQHEKIMTTDVKAKELRPIVERVITLSRKARIDTSASESDQARARAARVHAMRIARRWVIDRDALQRLFSVYADRYSQRPGGYTRIIKLENRAGDNAPMSMIQLIEDDGGGTTSSA